MNLERFEKFEKYLQGEMGEEEKTVFEAELSSNEELNSEFKVYRTIETEMSVNEQNSGHENELKSSLEILNARYFKPRQEGSTKLVSLYSNKLFKAAMAIAAGLVVLLAAYFVFIQPVQDPQYLANHYIETHLQQLSQTMDASADSLQLGISAYNNKEFDKALHFFRGVQDDQPENSEAIKNAGFAYLVTEDYDKALQQFDNLAAMKNLYSNPGLFLKAVTLIQRNEEGDIQEAKQFLEQVVKEEAEGSDQAEEWLKNF